MADVRASVAPEVSIEILPRGYTIWSGTADQLVAEGILPPAFDWARADGSRWTAGSFEFHMTRRKPRHLRSKEWRAAGRDNWQVQRRATGTRGSIHAARIHAATEALAYELWLASCAAMTQYRQVGEAVDDKAFQAFLVLATGQRGRG